MRALSAFLLSGLVVLGLLIPSPALAEALARLVSLTGPVEVVFKGQGHPARENEELFGGETIRTGAKASATLMRRDGTTVELMPFAELTIEDEQGFTVLVGRVWSHFVHAVSAPFFIKTPNATALIRGTTLGVGFEEGQSKVVVVEGLVEVRGPGDTRQLVGAGFRVEVNRIGRMGAIEHAAPHEMAEGNAFRTRHGLDRASVAPKAMPPRKPEHPPAGPGGPSGPVGPKAEFKTQGAAMTGREPAPPRRMPNLDRMSTSQHRLDRLDHKAGEQVQRRQVHGILRRTPPPQPGPVRPNLTLKTVPGYPPHPQYPRIPMPDPRLPVDPKPVPSPPVPQAMDHVRVR
jgi:hypothetical protein